MFHRAEPLTDTVWENLMLGLSTRKYGQAVREFAEANGLEKSAISEHSIEASREKLKAMKNIVTSPARSFAPDAPHFSLSAR